MILLGLPSVLLLRLRGSGDPSPSNAAMDVDGTVMLALARVGGFSALEISALITSCVKS